MTFERNGWPLIAYVHDYGKLSFREAMEYFRGAMQAGIGGDINHGMQETMHLLGSEKNAARLHESIAEFRAGNASIKELKKN